MGVVLVLVVLLAMPVESAMARPDTSALMAAAAKQRRPLTLLEKLHALRLPGMAGVRIVREDAPGTPPDQLAGGATIGRTIYDPENLLHGDRFALGHEMFHVLDQGVMRTRDRRRLMRVTGMHGPWGRNVNADGEYSRPDEVLADWFGALTAGYDPAREWESAYAQAPTRRRLLRFGRAVERMGRRYDLPRYRAPGM